MVRAVQGVWTALTRAREPQTVIADDRVAEIQIPANDFSDI
jgi:hypothetical protein